MWKKARLAIKALNNWKRVRADVLLFGTHNYDFRPNFNIMTNHEINMQVHHIDKKHAKTRDNKVKPLDLTAFS